MATKTESTIIELLKSVERPGIDELIIYLEESDYFVAPASTRFHGSYEGGLADHSLNVYYELEALVNFYEVEVSKESIILVALLHDVCKINQYEKTTVNVPPNRSASGKWEQQPGYVRKDKLPMGHGAKSVYRVQNYIKLSEAEAQAIYWHMGAFDLGNYSGVGDLSDSYNMNRLAVLLHMADLACTYIVEN